MRTYIPSSLPREVYKRVTSIIRDYPYLKYQLEEARRGVLESSPGPPDGQPRSSTTSDSTFAKAAALSRLDMLDWRIKAFEDAWKQLGGIEQQIIRERYWQRLPDGSYTSLRRLKPYRNITVAYSERTIRRLHQRFILILAVTLKEI